MIPSAACGCGLPVLEASAALVVVTVPTVSRGKTGLILCMGESGVVSSTTTPVPYRVVDEEEEDFGVDMAVAVVVLVVVGLNSMASGGCGGYRCWGVDDRYALLVPLVLVPIEGVLVLLLLIL